MSTWQLHRPSAELAARYRATGYWRDETVGRVLSDCLDRNASQIVRVWSEARPYRGTVFEVAGWARRFAGWLRDRGIGPQDVVAYYLPNWIEAAVVFWGAALVGAIIEPIAHIYGPREVGFILRTSHARLLVTMDSFGRTDPIRWLDDLRSDLPELEFVLMTGTASSKSLPFAESLSSAPDFLVSEGDADLPALVTYTSGTTAEPKGVIHTHNSWLGDVSVRLRGQQRSSTSAARRRPGLVGGPVGHISGALGALVLPLVTGQPIHLVDAWKPAQVIDAMREDDLVLQGGATYFLTSLLEHPGFLPSNLDRVRSVGLGGSPIPEPLARRAAELGISLTRSYGSTEHPATTGTRHDDPEAKRLYTDGRPLPEVEIRVLNDDGKEAPRGCPGELQSRGANLFSGYTDPNLTELAITTDGWYITGDIGVIDEDGYLTITDRKKDIIIRGGENISAAEVEDLLHAMPTIAEVAVVAAPDLRMGERACAVIRVVRDASPPDLDAVRAHLMAAGLARQKWPEELKVVVEFPRTATGKIKKGVLRDELRARHR